MAAGGEVADGAGNGIDAFLALAIKTMTQTILVFLLGLLQVIAVGLVSWSLLQSVRNGREIVELRSELAVRVENANHEHADFVRRAEIISLADQITRLGLAITTLTSELRIEREARIRREGQDD